MFGATTYVLEPKLQNSDVNIHKKYNPRNSRMEIIGFRYMHSTKTTLVLNLENQEHLPIGWVYIHSLKLELPASDMG